MIRDQKYQLQQRLSKGNYFGDLALFSEDKQRKANVFADTYVYVYALNKCDLDKCLSEFPKTRRHIEEVVQERSQIYKAKSSIAEKRRESKQFMGSVLSGCSWRDSL